MARNLDNFLRDASPEMMQNQNLYIDRFDIVPFRDEHNQILDYMVNTDMKYQDDSTEHKAGDHVVNRQLGEANQANHEQSMSLHDFNNILKMNNQKPITLDNLKVSSFAKNAEGRLTGLKQPVTFTKQAQLKFTGAIKNSSQDTTDPEVAKQPGKRFINTSGFDNQTDALGHELKGNQFDKPANYVDLNTVTPSQDSQSTLSHHKQPLVGTAAKMYNQSKQAQQKYNLADDTDKNVIANGYVSSITAVPSDEQPGYKLYMAARQRRDVDLYNDRAGKYLTNSTMLDDRYLRGQVADHQQEISKKDFDNLLNANGLKKLSNRDIDSAIKSHTPLATANDNLTFDARYQDEPTRFDPRIGHPLDMGRMLDMSTVTPSNHDNFNYQKIEKPLNDHVQPYNDYDYMAVQNDATYDKARQTSEGKMSQYQTDTAVNLPKPYVTSSGFTDSIHRGLYGVSSLFEKGSQKAMQMAQNHDRRKQARREFAQAFNRDPGGAFARLTFNKTVAFMGFLGRVGHKIGHHIDMRADQMAIQNDVTLKSLSDGKPTFDARSRRYQKLFKRAQRSNKPQDMQHALSFYNMSNLEGSIDNPDVPYRQRFANEAMTKSLSAGLSNDPKAQQEADAFLKSYDPQKSGQDVKTQITASDANLTQKSADVQTSNADKMPTNVNELNKPKYQSASDLQKFVDLQKSLAASNAASVAASKVAVKKAKATKSQATQSTATSDVTNVKSSSLQSVPSSSAEETASSASESVLSSHGVHKSTTKSKNPNQDLNAKLDDLTGNAHTNVIDMSDSFSAQKRKNQQKLDAKSTKSADKQPSAHDKLMDDVDNATSRVQRHRDDQKTNDNNPKGPHDDGPEV